MYSAIASSKPYRFFVGPQRRKFTIHSEVVAGISPYLDKLVNGDFKEGIENQVQWEDVDEETFVCFWQYAYTGDYDVPREPKTPEATIKGEGRGENEMKSPENANEPHTFVEVTTSGKSTNKQADPRMRKKHMKKRSKKRLTENARREEEGEEPKPEPSYEPPSKRKQLWEVFTALRLTNSYQVEVQPARESQRDDFYASDLLCHARVFAFADCYGIFDLMELSYSCIHRILCNLDLRTETLADIIAFVHYCYETPAPPDLKELVVLYSACNIEKLWVDEQFQHIIETHGDLSRAVIASLLGRLA
ncbi:BTB/POZ domain protein [Metarhizium robertsii]|uniref:BTB/POZ-like protein n=2 Tax=Metarhizium robertsii TaxID=568076 RepID=E9EU20_METRA|nr:BTB/POZ-like protein [Metarhizium robertsii ARSEF 23]EFZ00923.1 BTB/POZ-like protein [Metarhizium robertsii ARSEF 23]EXV03454.1 BTB/POZ domain protein [Metarhizium robertsii]